MSEKMRTIKIEKLTINIGSGKEQANLNRAITVVKEITGLNPVKTITNKRIASWGLRPGLPIGCKITLRRKQIPQILQNLLNAKDNILSARSFDNLGNISFGIKEHIDIPGIKYDPKIGVMGLQACITLERPGFRTKKRKLFNSVIGKRHKITKQEAIDFMKKNYSVKIKEEIDKEELGE
jgi:large subunit ribosomal protein L5